MHTNNKTLGLSRPVSRRSFVKLAALAAVPVPRFLAHAAEASPAANRGDSDKILVVVQLSGGNDGLNSVVPYEDDRYHRARPTLAIGKSQALRLDGSDDLGFHPQMTALHELYGEGKVSVIQGVGYPNPNRSHFRSMEIWHTARPETVDLTDGWLGRAVVRGVDALDIGDSTAPLALLAPGVQVPVLQNLNWLDALFSSKGSELRGMLRTVLEQRREGDAEFLRGATSATFTQLERIEAIRGKPLPVEYPNTSFGQRLEWTGQMIAGGLSSRIYYVSMDGFDTHAQQQAAHAQLMQQFSSGVTAFQRHMEKLGMADRVVVLAFSEFGRRVKENGSQGTDHGVAGPMWVVSGACRGGVIGEAPNLVDLTQGDVRHSIDFRRVYATAIDRVLGLSAREILGGEFDHVPFLKGKRSARL